MKEVSAQDVKKLREITGAGILSCQKALKESSNDFEKALDFLKSNGKQISFSRAEKIAGDGAVFLEVSTDGMMGVIILLSSETDFVAKTKEFTELGKQIVKACLSSNEGVKTIPDILNLFIGGETIGNCIIELSGKVGEKIQLSQAKFLHGDHVVSYEHPGNRLSVLLAIEGPAFDEQITSDIAMQIASMNPIAISIHDIPSSIIDRETEIAKTKVKHIDKSDAILEKMVKGMVNKAVEQSTLLCQPFIKNDKISVEEYMNSKMKDSKIKNFARLSID